MSKMINTALGTLDVNSLGETLCHEHVVCMNPSFYMAFGKNWMDLKSVEERIREELNLVIGKEATEKELEKISTIK